MMPKLAPANSAAIPLHVVETQNFPDWLTAQKKAVKNWVNVQGFDAKLGRICLLPDEHGQISGIVFGWGEASARARGRFHLARAAKNLPTGIYQIISDLPESVLEECALGWLLAGYQFDRYKKGRDTGASLCVPKGVDAPKIEAMASAAFLTRELIDTPTNDMGPDQLEKAFDELARAFKAKTTIIIGDDLLKHNLPLVHAVGRASDQAPRILDMTWGNKDHPKVTLVGKGVCFDTGGLNIKPGASMGLMKKDMGGGATVMGLAQAIMRMNLPVQLRVIVPTVENSISAGAFRPGDILPSRKGLSVEINNTDAEGRLVLADALALADEERPDLLICMATLTGAARVALGQDIVPFYCDDDELAAEISAAGDATRDPLWRMPFWEPYENLIEPKTADLDNAPKGGFAGSITAGLFLRRFVENAEQFAHFDIYGWSTVDTPSQPVGGAFQGARALFEVISNFGKR